MPRTGRSVVGAPPARLKRWAMNAIYAGLVVALFPYALFRFVADHKTRSRWRAYGKDLVTRYKRRVPRAGERPSVWVHGVSVGEIKSVARLVQAIEAAHSGVDVVISVSTDTGRRVADELYPGHRVEFYPPDLSWIVQDAFTALRPDLIVLVESGFWPTFLGVAHEKGIPVVVVNGRMSERSARRYGLVRPLVRQVLGTLSEVGVQLDAYGNRFAELGVAPARIHVTGNMKFDNIPIQSENPRRRELAHWLDLAEGERLVVAGSTHPSEERSLARIGKRLGENGLPFRLLIAPRHPARADHVEADLQREGLEVARRSRMQPGATAPRSAVVLLDTVGELETVYTLADMVFVGGTLVRHGGQNMMEPASLGIPVVVGPHVVNFRGEVELLVGVDGLVVAPDEAAVEETLSAWLREPEEAARLGRRAQEAILASKGATERSYRILRPLLERIEAHTDASVRSPTPVSG